MDTLIKKLKLENVRVMINNSIVEGKPLLLCCTKDFKEIVGEEIFDELKGEESNLFYGNKKEMEKKK